MNIEKRIASFVEVGARLRTYETDPVFSDAARVAAEENPWFTPDFIRFAIHSWSELLDPRTLTEWIMPYRDRLDQDTPPCTVGVVMAGNIPMVGFHDMLCVLLTGNRLLAKLSTQDRRLLPAIGRVLAETDPEWDGMITFTEGRMDRFDKVIATGSNNTSRYFEYYFGRYPHIIRKNRSSVAILTGEESGEELWDLALDVFLYFGLGCRNVSKLFLPEGYDLARLAEPFSRFGALINHNKYRNNYDYHKAMMMVSGSEYHDGGFYLMVPSMESSSPVAVIRFEYYSDEGELTARLEQERVNLQCIVGTEGTPGCTVRPGKSQLPRLQDYADNIDTMVFLTEKN
jgi:hypothetical protein